MTFVDVKSIQEKAKAEIAKETHDAAVEKLKDLYRRREKAELVVRNINREIDGYLADVAELSTYESAGVDTQKNG